MLKRIPLGLALLLPGAAASGTAWAAPGDVAVMTGTTQATVVAPTRIQPLDDLRFGQFYRPIANGNVTISTTGAVTATGGMVGLTNAVQIGTGRGAARFRINGDPNRDFKVDLPNQIDIFHGTASMRVSNFTHNVPSPRGNLGPAGSFILRVGARLRVNANQPVGLYQGNYVVTVTYQ